MSKLNRRGLCYSPVDGRMPYISLWCEGPHPLDPTLWIWRGRMERPRIWRPAQAWTIVRGDYKWGSIGLYHETTAPYRSARSRAMRN